MYIYMCVRERKRGMCMREEREYGSESKKRELILSRKLEKRERERVPFIIPATLVISSPKQLFRNVLMHGIPPPI